MGSQKKTLAGFISLLFFCTAASPSAKADQCVAYKLKVKAPYPRDAPWKLVFYLSLLDTHGGGNVALNGLTPIGRPPSATVFDVVEYCTTAAPLRVVPPNLKQFVRCDCALQTPTSNDIVATLANKVSTQVAAQIQTALNTEREDLRKIFAGTLTRIDEALAVLSVAELQPRLSSLQAAVANIELLLTTRSQ